jgi:hypothetical protein
MTYRALQKLVNDMGKDALDFDVTIEVDGEFFAAKFVYQVSEESDSSDIVEAGTPVIVLN